MKSHTVISTTVATLLAAVSIPAQATGTPDEKPAATAQTAQSAPAAKKHAAQDRSKHYHPRDGK